ncbi:MAG: MotA/TolQ/ExbB proton channel family protein [Cytophagales bacterium]|nr:MAG: MotA/TolQ/ExbB proton channel family protein [Cytophagales bacterium]
MFLLKFLQITTPIAAPEVATEDSIRLIDLVMKGGFIMIPIFILSIITVYIFIERYLTIKNATKNSNLLINNIKSSVKTGDIKSAQTSALASNTAIGLVLLKGINKIGQPIKTIEAAMESAGKLQIMSLEKNLGILGIIASIAPMLGFVGTISGVIKIFYNISLADNISIGLIAGGLYEKMVTSAAGLIVGMLAHIAYHYLYILLDNVTHTMESTSLEFIETVSE